MSEEKYIKELEEIVSYFKEDGIYALKGLEDKIKYLNKCTELLNDIDAEWCENWDKVVDFFGEEIANKLDQLILDSQSI